MNEAFRAAGVPLFVAYYRRALDRFLEVRRLLDSGAIGQVTDVHVRIAQALASGEQAANAHHAADTMVFTGTLGELTAPVFSDGDVAVRCAGQSHVLAIRNPPHVHQPLIQSIVDELLGRGRCESTGESAARTSWVMEQCIDRRAAAV